MADTEFQLFSKSTFMNLCNFAEDKGATSIILILDKEHNQKKEYRRMFKVIDADRIRTSQVKSLLKEDQMKATAEYSFFQMELWSILVIREEWGNF